MDELFFIGLFGSLLIFLIYMFIRGISGFNKQLQAWQKFAESVNLKFEGTRIFKAKRIYGLYRGRELVVDNLFQQRGKYNTSVLRLRISILNPTGRFLKITPSKANRKLLSRIKNRDDLTVENTIFSRMKISTNDDTSVKNLLKDLKESDKELLFDANFVSLEFNPTYITFQKLYLLKDDSKLIELVDMLVFTAQRFDGRYPNDGLKLPESIFLSNRKELLKGSKNISLSAFIMFITYIITYGGLLIWILFIKS